MISLTERLPEDVCVAGVSYPIHADFRDWVRFDMMLHDPDVSPEERVAVMYTFFNTADPPPQYEDAIKALVGFFCCGNAAELGEGEAARPKRNERVVDFSQDAGRIIAAFRQAYQIDLLTISYMHWWEFRALLDALPENTRFVEVVGYRAADTAGLDKKARERIGRLKTLYAIAAKRVNHAETIVEREARMIARVQASQNRGKKGG